MAFVHRTNRDNCRIGGYNVAGSAAESLGPGSYDTEAGIREQEGRTKAHSSAPFSTSAKRNGVESGTKGINIGPGAYDWDTSYSKVRGSNTLASAAFRSTSDRIPKMSANELIPGPGAYSTEQQITSSSATQKSKVGRFIVLAKNATVPSIPRGNQAFGYEEKEDGSLKRREPKPQHDHLNRETTDNQNGYKEARGIDFAKVAPREKKRLTHYETPGPGSYNIHQWQSEEKYDEMQRVACFRNPALKNAMRQRSSAAFAPHTSSIKTESGVISKSIVPGPGAYSVLSELGERKNSLGKKRDAFGSTTTRFSSSGSDSRPAFYNLGQSSFVDTWNAYRYEGKRFPFNSGAPRTAPNLSREKKPPIGTYHVPGMAEELKLKMALVPRKRNAPFGTSSSRFRSNTREENSSEEVMNVSASTAMVPYRGGNTVSKTKKGSKLSAEFKSATQRGFVNDKNQNPAPGSYDTHEVTSLAREIQKKRGKGVIEAGLSRSHGTRLEEYQMIGPGAYEKEERNSWLKSKGRNVKSNGFLSKSERFATVAKDETPGPGQYGVASDSFLQLTYNLTIAEEEEKALRRQGFA